MGIILGSKIFIHFMKYDFQECIRRLKMELVHHFTPIPIKIPQENNIDTKKTIINYSQKIKEPQGQIVNKTKLDWTEEDVNKWLLEKNIHSGIIKMIQQCDGKLLHELFLIKNEAPEFFFDFLHLNNSSEINIRDYAIFIKEFNKLFD